jgi:phage regulator Rha-like protein
LKKTLRKILKLGFLLFGIVVYGQEFEFDIQNTSLSEYLEMEQNLGSERITTIRNHVSSNGNAQPIKFKREQKIISDLVAYYYFKEKDSVMSHILYEWDESLLTLKPNSKEKKSKEYQIALIEKFNELEKKLTELYGEPKSRGDLSDLKQAELKGGLKKNDKWYPNDNTEIEMYIVVSNYYKKSGMITIAPTHRIRLYIRKLKTE